MSPEYVCLSVWTWPKFRWTIIHISKRIIARCLKLHHNMKHSQMGHIRKNILVPKNDKKRPPTQVANDIKSYQSSLESYLWFDLQCKEIPGNGSCVIHSQSKSNIFSLRMELPFRFIWNFSECRFHELICPGTVGQRNYFTTSVTVLYELPFVAVLSITGNNNVIFCTLRQYQFHTLRPTVKYMLWIKIYDCRKVWKNIVK